VLRVVLDTNIIVSSLLSPSGAPAAVLDAWRELRFVLLLSPAMLEELRCTLARPRIRRKYGVAAKDVGTICQALERYALWVKGDTPFDKTVLSDADDVKFLACALEGRADCIVSGDHHLLQLGVFAGIPILSARQFLEQLAVQSADEGGASGERSFRESIRPAS